MTKLAMKNEISQKGKKFLLKSIKYDINICGALDCCFSVI